jgi:hypothetical protein
MYGSHSQRYGAAVTSIFFDKKTLFPVISTVMAERNIPPLALSRFYLRSSSSMAIAAG